MRKRNRPYVIRWHSVSKDKSPVQYHLRLLQLYLPWRNEDELCHSDGTYTTRFEEVESLIHDAIMEYEPYDELTTEDLENAYHSSDDDTYNSDIDSDDEFSIFNPINLDFDTETTDSGAPTSGSTVKARGGVWPFF